MSNYAIEFKNLTKVFPGIKANDDISFGVKEGTIHALIGENGAGKSTLMSVLFGLYQPDGGEILINGIPTVVKGPNHANELGISMVHQHFKIVDNFTNLQNIVLGSETTHNSLLDMKFPSFKVKLIQDKYNLHFDLKQKTGKATVATQQKVEIMKMLYRDADILIFDEPTAVLTPQEIEGFLETLKGFRDKGKTVIFISHKLNEVLEVADRATVIRHGKSIKTFETMKDVSIEDMAQAMVGDKVVMPKNQGNIDFSNNEILLSVKNLFAKEEKRLENVSFDLRAGEILAIAGVEGNGQEELEHVLGGLIRPTSGLIQIYPYNSYKKKFSKYIILKTNDNIYYKSMNKINDVKNKFNSQISDFLDKSKDSIKSVFSKTKKDEKPTSIESSDSSNEKNKVVINEVPVLNQKMLDTTYMSVQSRINHGVAYVPGDRHKYGLTLDFSIRDNAIMRRLNDPKSQFGGFIKTWYSKSLFKKIQEEFDVRGSRNGVAMARSLSGGNQQKAIVGRELISDHQISIIVQPTRGLDVGAINNIHQHILAEKAANKAVLLISYELDEVLALADTIAVMHAGKLTKKIPIGSTNRNEIGLMMAGIHE